MILIYLHCHIETRKIYDPSFKLIGGLEDVEFTSFFEHVELYEIHAQEDFQSLIFNICIAIVYTSQHVHLILCAHLINVFLYL